MIKVLIADDENLICQMIYKMIDWKAKGLSVCGFAGNGFEVLEKVRTEQPDIVITDIRMPGIDGLSMIEQARALKTDMDFIIISGNRNFDYAQSALHLGVDHYLLKPINKDELAGALDQTVGSRLKKSGLSEASELEKIKTSGAGNFLQQDGLDMLLQDRTLFFRNAEEEKETGQDLYLPETEDKDTGGDVCYLSFIAKVDSEIQPSGAKEVLEMICKIIEYRFSEAPAEYIQEKVESGLVVVLRYSPAYAEKIEPFLEGMFGHCSTEIDKFEGFSVTFGVSSRKDRIAQLRDAVSEAAYAVQARMKAGTDRILRYDQLNYKNPPLDSYFTASRETVFISVVKSADIHAFFSDNSELMEYYNSQPDLSPSIFFRFVVHTEKIIRRIWREEGVPADICADFSRGIIIMLDSATDADRLLWSYCNLYSSTVRKIQEVSRKKEELPVIRAKTYLEEHFMDNPSARAAAEAAGITEAELEEAFPAATGVSFSEYRIFLQTEKAEELLKKTDSTFAEIAEEIGCRDERTFEKEFRRNVGLKPGEYRKLYR